MEIAHLSDLHLSSAYRPRNLYFTQVLIEFLLQREVDHIVITGDITHNSEMADFRQLRKLFENYNLLDSQKLTVIVGNHDIFGGVHLAEDILLFPEKCEKTDYVKKLNELNYFFLETFDGVFRHDPKNLYPFAKSLRSLVLVGINSIAPYSKLKNLFASKGKITHHQQRSLKKIFTHPGFRDKTRIVLIHHHFNRYHPGENGNKLSFLQNIEGRSMRLKGKKQLISQFKKHGVSMVLHGHLHQSGEYEKKGLRFFNAGGTIDGNPSGQLKLNLIRIQNGSIETEIKSLLLNTPRVARRSSTQKSLPF